MGQSGDGCAYGTIRVKGINTDTFKAGHIEICVNMTVWTVWRTVCADGWDEHAAKVACKELYPESGVKFYTYNSM